MKRPLFFIPFLCACVQTEHDTATPGLLQLATIEGTVRVSEGTTGVGHGLLIASLFTEPSIDEDSRPIRNYVDYVDLGSEEPGHFTLTNIFPMDAPLYMHVLHDQDWTSFEDQGFVQTEADLVQAAGLSSLPEIWLQSGEVRELEVELQPVGMGR